MAAIVHPHTAFGRPGGRPGRPSLHPLVARLRGSALDRQLAGGAEPWRSPVYAARAVQITSPRARRSLARALELMIERAERLPAPIVLGSAIPVNRQAVSAARPLMLELAARLRYGGPVDARAVAALHRLLSDGTGPCYAPRGGDALLRALAEIQDTLDVPG